MPAQNNFINRFRALILGETLQRYEADQNPAMQLMSFWRTFPRLPTVCLMRL